ncbi:hypothetical protein MTR_5g022360 [Medicago truncatula]|uniref:Uncharacterized protein n=1 Tax=Medicago truncatula TaxID=3880 RepID=G7JXH8_MEDTR|nr:hypothetical protein MTR_5g022360 [Medicago truncatula]
MAENGDIELIVSKSQYHIRKNIVTYLNYSSPSLLKLSDQLRSSADQINDFRVINVADLETMVFRRLKYSHMCRL